MGRNGSIIYHTGNVWTKLESGTDNDFEDIWGSGDKILCVTDGNEVFNIVGNSVNSSLNWSNGPLGGVWFGEKSPVYVSGYGAWFDGGRGWELLGAPTSNFFVGIRGTASNDLFVIGWVGIAGHYNGSTWHFYNELSNPAWAFQSVALTNDLVAAVGFTAVVVNDLAVAVIGIRTK